MSERKNTDAEYRRRIELEIRCREMGHRLKEQLPPGCGFTLLLYDYGEGGVLSYISTGKREDCKRMLEEFLSKVLVD